MSLDDPVTGAKGKTKVMKISGEPNDWKPTQREKDVVTCVGVPLSTVRERIHLSRLSQVHRARPGNDVGH